MFSHVRVVDFVKYGGPKSLDSNQAIDLYPPGPFVFGKKAHIHQSSLLTLVPWEVKCP